MVDYLRAGGESIANSPIEKITAYVGFLANEDCVNDGLLTGDRRSLNRKIEAGVIQAEDVPESYFELQKRIAREQGHGDITITSAMRETLIEAVQNDQRASIKRWADYLSSPEDGAEYPAWFRIYAFDGVKKLGSLDPEKMEFSKRTKATAGPYPELNSEALSRVYDLLYKSKIANEDLAVDDKLQKIVNSANFGKLYAYALSETSIINKERKINEGTWTKYNQSKDLEDAQTLASSLQGYGTGWCTAGEQTAHYQLRNGDFYVYYSENEDGDAVVPRVAIRMQGNKVAEVRGTQKAQNLEPEMLDIAKDKLEELPGGDLYSVKAEDMKRLTTLEKKLKENPEDALTEEEVRLLYEIDHKVVGFGHKADPRTIELRSLRGDQDRPVIKELIQETIRYQLKHAYQTYLSMSHGLDVSALAKSEVTDAFLAKDRQWKTDGTYDFIIEQLIEGGTTHELIVTPSNVDLSQIQSAWENVLFEDDGADWLANPTPFNTDAAEENDWDYDDDEEDFDVEPVSKSSVNVRLIQSYPLVEDQMEIADADKLLEQHQVQHASVRIGLPDLLDVVTYWHMYVKAGKTLSATQSYFYAGSRNDKMDRNDKEKLYATDYLLDNEEPNVSYYREEVDQGPRFIVG